MMRKKPDTALALAISNDDVGKHSAFVTKPNEMANHAVGLHKRVKVREHRVINGEDRFVSLRKHRRPLLYNQVPPQDLPLNAIPIARKPISCLKRTRW